MQRRTALTAAGSISLAAVAVSLGIAVNLGILRSGTKGVGDLAYATRTSPDAATTTSERRAPARTTLTTTTAATEYVTYYQDVPAPAAPRAPSPEPADTTAPPGASSPATDDDPDDDSGGPGGGQPAEGDDPDGDADEGDVEDDDSDDGGPAATTPPTTTAPTTSRPAPASTTSYDAGGAGTVTAQVSSYSMKVVGTSPASGWTATVKAGTGEEVLVEFTGPGGKVIWKAHVEAGHVSVELEVED